MHRRHFLQQASLFTGSTLATLGLQGWIARSDARSQPKPKRLIVLFLRGAADGLSVVVPYREAAYYQNRPAIALPQPGQKGGVLDLDGQFGLHPDLAPMMAQWQAGHLAFVHASGSNDATRSHFDAQNYMENGTPGTKTTASGWMNRLLAALPDQSPVQAISLGQTTPLILQGTKPVANLAFNQKSTIKQPLDQVQVRSAFDRLYQGQDALGQTYAKGRETRERLLAIQDSPPEDPAELKVANKGAPSVQGFAAGTQRLGHLMNRDPGIQLVFLDVAGWDTHVSQVPRLSNQLRGLAQGLSTLIQALGPVYQDTAIIVMSEFGRTVKENGNRGTDHGHGNVLWLLGGNLRGGKVYGDWPGLAPGQLYEDRDLAITTDFRTAIASVLVNHLQLDNTKIKQIFPGYSSQSTLPIL
jgi:uncharacterized protein (DUF1501 family)